MGVIFVHQKLLHAGARIQNGRQRGAGDGSVRHGGPQGRICLYAGYAEIIPFYCGIWINHVKRMNYQIVTKWKEK